MDGIVLERGGVGADGSPFRDAMGREMGGRTREYDFREF